MGQTIGSCARDDGEFDGGRSSTDRYRMESLFVVVGLKGATVRKDVSTSSPVVAQADYGMELVVDEIRDRRAHISSPIEGWASTESLKRYRVLAPVAFSEARKWRVLHQDGVIVRKGFSITHSEEVRSFPFGSVLQGTGHVHTDNGLDRVRIEYHPLSRSKGNKEVAFGWVSTHLLSDDGSGRGAALLEPLPTAENGRRKSIPGESAYHR